MSSSVWGRSNGAWFPMALSCGSLPALIETFPWAKTSWGWFFFFFPNLLSRLHRCSVRCTLGLSCRMGIPRGCFLDVSFLLSCLACFRIFLCCSRCNLWSKSARSFRQSAGGESCRHIHLQHTGQLAKAGLLCEKQHDSVNLLLRNGGTERGSGVPVFHLVTVELWSRLLNHLDTLLICSSDAILRMSIALSSF